VRLWTDETSTGSKKQAQQQTSKATKGGVTEGVAQLSVDEPSSSSKQVQSCSHGTHYT